jgi:predicted DNA-binding protein (MmcQ/YjbR family)
VSDYADVADEIVERFRAICMALPEAREEKAWAGTRWLIRKQTFAHVIGAKGVDVVTFRSEPPELQVLQHAGHPFFYAGWGRDVVGMVIDGNTDWEEVAELMSDSYCVMAPKKLRAALEGAL